MAPSTRLGAGPVDVQHRRRRGGLRTPSATPSTSTGRTTTRSSRGGRSSPAITYLPGREGEHADAHRELPARRQVDEHRTSCSTRARRRAGRPGSTTRTTWGDQPAAGRQGLRRRVPHPQLLNDRDGPAPDRGAGPGHRPLTPDGGSRPKSMRGGVGNRAVEQARCESGGVLLRPSLADAGGDRGLHRRHGGLRPPAAHVRRLREADADRARVHPDVREVPRRPVRRQPPERRREGPEGDDLEPGGAHPPLRRDAGGHVPARRRPARRPVAVDAQHLRQRDHRGGLPRRPDHRRHDHAGGADAGDHRPHPELDAARAGSSARSCRTTRPAP